jgi:N utilization substance protein B
MQRREAREFVLTALYRREFLPTPLQEMLDDVDAGDQAAYIESTFAGILEHQGEIDRMLGERTVGWRFERLSLIDRNILRLAAYEILFSGDVPAEVAIDEAVELAKAYGTDQAPVFINGILDRLWKEEKT